MFYLTLLYDFKKEKSKVLSSKKKIHKVIN